MTAEATTEASPAKAIHTGGSQHIAERNPPATLEMVDYDPCWPSQYQELRERIAAAMGLAALSITHVGSTCVPGLAAKPIIDIDVVVADIRDESTYVPALEKAGFQFLLRQPDWYEHRLFVNYKPEANIHIWTPTSGQITRHSAFTAWLKAHPDDLERYAQAKREACKLAKEHGENADQYGDRKNAVLKEVMTRALAAVGETLQSTGPRVAV